MRDVQITGLAEAVAVLNHRHHRGWDDWRVWDGGAIPGHGETFDFLSEFEAIAIAEKYLGDYLPESQLG